MVALAAWGRLRTPVAIWLLLVAILVTASVATAIFVVPSYLRPMPDFSLQPVDTSRPVFAGSGGSCEFRVMVNSLNGFTGIVLFTTVVPANLSVGRLAVASNPNLANPLALLGRNDTLFVDVGSSDLGNYTFTITGTSGVLSHSVTLAVITQSLTFTINPDPIRVVNASAPNGGSVRTNSTMTVIGVDGFSGNLYLSVYGAVGAFAHVYPSNVYGGPAFLPFRGTASATITAEVPSYGTSSVCKGPGYVIILATNPNRGGVFHTFATACV